LNDASLDITKKKEVKKEAMYSQIKIELQGVQQALHSRHVVSTVPLSVRTPEEGEAPAQLHRIMDSVEAQLRKAQDEAEKAIQALTQV
jgi:hypothetical protein